MKTPEDRNEQRPLGEEVFGAMWPDGAPPGWPEETADAYRLVIDLDVPPDVSDEDVLRHLAAIAGAADAYHRALGFTGLEIESAEAAVTANVDAEVPA